MKQHKFDADQYARNMEALPETCFAQHIMDDSLILIRRGESGFVPAADKWPPVPGEPIEAQVRRLNERMGVTTAQRMAMVMGSIAGRFDLPGAHPDQHLGRAFVEDLNSVEPTLGYEASTMLRDGATYEQVRDRFKSIMMQAQVCRDYGCDPEDLPAYAAIDLTCRQLRAERDGDELENGIDYLIRFKAGVWSVEKVGPDGPICVVATSKLEAVA